jgi:hypothetical protein
MHMLTIRRHRITLLDLWAELLGLGFAPSNYDTREQLRAVFFAGASAVVHCMCERLAEGEDMRTAIDRLMDELSAFSKERVYQS